MGTTSRRNRKQVAQVKNIPVLDEPPPEPDMVLLVRNESDQTYCLQGSGGQADIVLFPQQECLAASPWTKDAALRRYVHEKKLTAEWVAQTYQPFALPEITSAPEEILPDSDYDRNYAHEIAITRDLDKAHDLINQKANIRFTTTLDVPWMKTRMAKILRLALWLEEQIQDRAKVKSDIKQRLDEIDAM